MKDIKKLLPGDEITWNDPDDGICSGTYTINTIKIKNDIVCIDTTDGSYIECFARELK